MSLVSAPQRSCGTSALSKSLPRSPVQRRCIRIAASAEAKPNLRNQIAISLQTATYLWAPAALAFTQGDLPTSVSKAQSATETATSKAASAAESLPNELPDWLSDNPLLLAGIVVAVALPVFVIGNLLGGSKSKVKPISAEAAYAILQEKPNAFLLDVRRKKEASSDGTPDIRSTKRRVETLPFSQVGPDGELTPDPNFAAGFAKLRSVEAGAVAILLDTFGTEAAEAAKAIDDTELEAVLTITGGVDGLNGWKASELPWKEPVRLPKFGGFSGRLNSLADDFQSQPTLTKAGLAVGAAGAAGLFIFQEAGTVLEVLGVLAGVRFLGNRFLFAKDRKETLDLIQGLRDGKAEMPKDVKKDLTEFQTALRLPGADETVRAGGKSSGTSPSTGVKVSATPAAKEQKSAVKEQKSAAPSSTSQPALAAKETKAVAEKRTEPAANSEEARNWINSWRSKGTNGTNGSSPEQVAEAKEEVSEEKSRESANI